MGIHLIRPFANENDMVNQLVRYARKRKDLIVDKHEDKYRSGISDLTYATYNGPNGIIEAKHARCFKGDSKTVRLRRFTVEQRAYLLKHHHMGVPSWCLLGIGVMVYLIPAPSIDNLRGDDVILTRDDSWVPVLSWEFLREYLAGNRGRVISL
jgi:hypothetical protein